MIALPPPSAWLLDLDGVLVDSEPAHVGAYARLFGEVGVTFDRETYRRVAAGRSREETLRAVLGDLPPDRLAALMRRKVELMREWIAERGLSPLPGALDLVARIRAAGLPLAVVTSSRTPDLLLRGADIDPALFDVVVDGGSVRRAKPDPALYLRGAAALGITPETCWVVEDAPAGVAAGKAAGCTVIAIAGAQSIEALGAADRVVERLADISWPGPG